MDYHLTTLPARPLPLRRPQWFEPIKSFRDSSFLASQASYIDLTSDNQYTVGRGRWFNGWITWGHLVDAEGRGGKGSRGLILSGQHYVVGWSIYCLHALRRERSLIVDNGQIWGRFGGKHSRLNLQKKDFRIYP